MERFSSTSHCAMEWDLVYSMIWKGRFSGAQKLPRKAIWKQSEQLLHVTAGAGPDFEKMRVRHFGGIYWLLKQVTEIPNGRSIDVTIVELELRRTVSRPRIG